VANILEMLLSSEEGERGSGGRCLTGGEDDPLGPPLELPPAGQQVGPE